MTTFATFIPGIGWGTGKADCMEDLRMELEMQYPQHSGNILVRLTLLDSELSDICCTMHAAMEEAADAGKLSIKPNPSQG